MSKKKRSPFYFIIMFYKYFFLCFKFLIVHLMKGIKYLLQPITNRIRFSITFKITSTYMLIFTFVLFFTSALIVTATYSYLTSESDKSFNVSKNIIVNYIEHSGDINKDFLSLVSKENNISFLIFNENNILVYGSDANQSISSNDSVINVFTSSGNYKIYAHKSTVKLNTLVGILTSMLLIFDFIAIIITIFIGTKTSSNINYKPLIFIVKSL